VRSLNWNLGNSADPAELIREFSGRAVLALHLCADMHKDPDVIRQGHDFHDEAELFRYVLDNMRDHTCLYFWFMQDLLEKGPVMAQIYRLLDERGYTPRAAGVA